VHSGGFAPAFTLLLCDSERSRKPPMPIASVVRGNPKKGKFPLTNDANDQKATIENQQFTWSLVRSHKNGKNID
jgi:hypothetical protein